jgi:hypothetical protein
MSNQTVKYQHLKLQVSNAAPSQSISVDLAPQGGSNMIAFSTGPDFGGSAGINITVSGDSLPLSSFYVTPQEVNVHTTASGGGGGTLTFTVALYLAAQQNLETFYLKSSSDPGVVVQAVIGEAQPQTVNSTPTLFSFNP